MMEMFKEMTWVTSAPLWAIALVALVTLIKMWPVLKQLTMDERDKLAADRRQDYKELKAEVELLKTRTEKAEKHCIASDVRVGQLEFVLRMLMDHLEDISPNDEVVKRAKLLLPAMFPIEPISDETTARMMRVTREANQS